MTIGWNLVFTSLVLNICFYMIFEIFSLSFDLLFPEPLILIVLIKTQAQKSKLNPGLIWRKNYRFDVHFGTFKTEEKMLHAERGNAVVLEILAIRGISWNHFLFRTSLQFVILVKSFILGVFRVPTHRL